MHLFQQDYDERVFSLSKFLLSLILIIKKVLNCHLNKNPEHKLGQNVEEQIIYRCAKERKIYSKNTSTNFQ